MKAGLECPGLLIIVRHLDVTIMSLHTFLTSLEDKVSLSLTAAETEDIEKGVSQFVTRLTAEVAKNEQLFTVKKIIKAGSFYEKTKIGKPDEFDFMVELEKNFILVPGCEGNPCSAHVQMPPEDLPKRPGLNVVGYLLSVPIFTQFRRGVEDALQAALFGFNDLERQQCSMGHLKIFEFSQGSGPNVEIHLVWTRKEEEGKDYPFSFGLSADLSLSIPCTDELLSVYGDSIRFSSLSVTHCDLPRPVLVSPSPSRMHSCELSKYPRAEYQNDHACWRISCAPAEVYMMQRLSQEHNLCYRLFKCLCKQKGTPVNPAGVVPGLKTLSSFMLKNAVLHHQESCHGADRSLTECFESILQYLIMCAEQKFLPAFFFPKINLWRSKTEGDVRPPLRILTRLSDFLSNDIGEKFCGSVTSHSLWTRVSIIQEEFMHLEAEDLMME